MIKPERLKKGDKVAIVSLSRGMLGEKWAIHKLDIAKKRLEEDFGLEVVVMPNALKGIDYLYKHPEARAKDLMDAFKDKSIKAIFNAIGGDDTIRLLPYIDFEVIKNNPKIFTGFSDTTSNHFMMQKAGLISYYGASVMNNFAEYVEINEYTKQALIDILFEPKDRLEIKPSSFYSTDEDKIWWKEENINLPTPRFKNEDGNIFLQGKSTIEGTLIGGCIDVMISLNGTSLWPTEDEWKDKILLLEMSEANISPIVVGDLLRNFMTQGILKNINGIIIGRPAVKDYAEEYKEVIKNIVSFEASRPDMPIIYNVNVGHAYPIHLLPLGERYQIDCDKKTLTLLEKATS